MTTVQPTDRKTKEERPMSMQEVISVVSRLQVFAEALAAVGGRLGITDQDVVTPEIAAAFDDVLAAAGIPDLDALAPPQKAMLAGGVRSFFAQAADLLAEPNREPGWCYTDPIVLDGQGRGSAIIPSVLAQAGEFKDVSSFLDVGVGIGGLAIGAAHVWPDSTIVGIDVWEPALERARRNISDAGLETRIELRKQNVVDLVDRDRFDLAWVPSFFFSRDLIGTALEQVVAALRPGGNVVVGRYEPPPDPLAQATLRLRTLRDGGSVPDVDTIADLLRRAGCTAVHQLPRTGPIPMGFIAGRKP
jgi:predicted O-methyltransferase YrrM